MLFIIVINVISKGIFVINSLLFSLLMALMTLTTFEVPLMVKSHEVTRDLMRH